ncbi:MAG TPA: adenosine deaminase [Euzebyales bacterium]|nr:adenosine deaminase [Euzebyales bacterium]
MRHDVGVLTPSLIRRAPKVLLHDHLDGGLRPQTIIDLAAARGLDLPTTDPDELGRWFTRGADRGSLELYLEGFAHTVAVMQSREELVRVAAECAEDLAADGVVYAEVRFAPELHIGQGLSLDDVVEAVLDGFRQRAAGRGITIGTLVTAMRTAARSPEIAELAVRWREHGVVGFDIAGAETGYPPTRHLDAFDHIRRENFHLTIHAGESFGLPSIWEALQFCGAERLGHGVRITDDIAWSGDPHTTKLGRLAAFVRDRRIPLEVCPTSNVHTRAAATLAEHPIDLLKRLRFRVTLNTDNRLMSGVSLSSEMQAMIDTFGWTLDDLQWVTINGMKSAFWPFDERLALINDVIKPGYAALRDEAA